ncbi:sugar phosphate isomerase/epimerase [Reichenbachiella sp. MALMAid0571]|uniref:sugar phosphate isomerase/epimerase family protein n=1 Tax=Reichenbachiella sp. MALMAid0571 TaxID=3143939 RepID=UPI0032DE8F65
MKLILKKYQSAFFVICLLLAFSTSYSYSQGKKPNSKIDGVQIGVITYSWRSMPGSIPDIISYCKQTGISSLELMGNVAEEYAGIPGMPDRLKKGANITDKQRAEHEKATNEAKENQKQWRISNTLEKYKEMRKMFDKAGIKIHIVKFSPANWSDEEIDYAFQAAKILGAKGVTNEIGTEACKRLGKFAEKHNMYAIFHNHSQPGDPDFSFDEFLSYSPNNMLNLDVGHYYGSTGKHPNEVIERLNKRIVSIHMKDKTGKNNSDPNQNRNWGDGETPLGDILQLIRDNKYAINCDIEVEYTIPDDSDAVKETKKCLEFCRAAIAK